MLGASVGEDWLFWGRHLRKKSNKFGHNRAVERPFGAVLSEFADANSVSFGSIVESLLAHVLLVVR